jgi:restriction alleviation protein, lar family
MKGDILSMQELRTCPFCNGEPEYFTSDDAPVYGYIICKKCGARTQKHYTASETIEAWNQRENVNKIFSALHDIGLAERELEKARCAFANYSKFKDEVMGSIVFDCIMEAYTRFLDRAVKELESII